MNRYECATMVAYGSTYAPDSTVVSDSRGWDSNRAYVGVEVVPSQDDFVDIEEILRTFRPDRAEAIADDPVYSELVELNSLDSPSIRLKKSIQLLSRVQDGEHVVELPQVELYAFGETLAEALDEVATEVVDLYATLSSSPANVLAGKPLSWKLFLDQYISKVDGE